MQVRQHGPGRHHAADVVFTGKCVEGFVSGPGEVMLLDGSRSIWSGDFQQGRLLKGVSESNSVSYEGEFRDNTAHGQGTLTFNDGSTFKGRFEYGPVGNTGEITFSNGGSKQRIGALPANIAH